MKDGGFAPMDEAGMEKNTYAVLMVTKTSAPY